MLILSRSRGEKVLIGDDIVVTVVRVDRGKVRLGFETPEGIEVDRSEIRELKNKRKEVETCQDSTRDLPTEHESVCNSQIKKPSV